MPEIPAVVGKVIQNYLKAVALIGLEFIFSRLLALCMQNPSVKGLNATANHCTIAYITVLLVALTTVKSGNQDKIRFVKKYFQTINFVNVYLFLINYN